MSVDQLPSGKARSPARDAKLVRYDQYIDTQIASTRRLVKFVDVTTVLVTLAASVLAFLLAVAVVEHWFVSGGFYVPDPAYQGQAWRSLVAVWWGTHQLSGYVTETIALVTALVLLLRPFGDSPEAILAAGLLWQAVFISGGAIGWGVLSLFLLKPPAVREQLQSSRR